MKKLIALTLSVTMILSLSACGKKEQIPLATIATTLERLIALTLATAALKALRSRSVALL